MIVLEVSNLNFIVECCGWFVGKFHFERRMEFVASIESRLSSTVIVTFHNESKVISSKTYKNSTEVFYFFHIFMGKTNYRGSPPYAHFGTWKKSCYMNFVLVGLYCGPLLTLIPPLTCT